MGLTNPGRILARSSLNLLTLSGIPPFSINSFWLASLLALLVELNYFSDMRACVVYQNHKSHSFRVRRGVLQGLVLDLSLLYKSFLQPPLTYASPGWFPFLSITNITKLERLQRAANCAITGCLSSSPIPLLLSEASSSPLQVTLTHSLCHFMRELFVSQLLFSFQVWPDLGVKPRLCRSSWRTLASIHPLMLPSISPREVILACSPSPPWSLPSFTVESILSSPRSRSDPLSCQDAALAHFDSFPPTIWCFGQMALILFFLAKTALAYLPTALSVALRPLFPFQQAQYAQVSLLKPAPFCKLFNDFGSTNKSATSPLLQPDSRSLLFSIFPFTSISLANLAGTVFCFLLFYQLQWIPGHSFFPRNDAADELARQGALLAPSAIPCSLSLISRIHS